VDGYMTPSTYVQGMRLFRVSYTDLWSRRRSFTTTVLTKGGVGDPYKSGKREAELVVLCALCCAPTATLRAYESTHKDLHIHRIRSAKDKGVREEKRRDARRSLTALPSRASSPTRRLPVDVRAYEDEDQKQAARARRTESAMLHIRKRSRGMI
jgi:hypothetical protein